MNAEDLHKIVGGTLFSIGIITGFNIASNSIVSLGLTGSLAVLFNGVVLAGLIIWCRKL